MTVTVLHGDCREVLRTLEPESVHCVVTSPPYFGLRDYGVAGQIGLEPTPDEYIAELVAVFAEVRRVLRKDGTVWLNLGDSYANTGGADRRMSLKSTIGRSHSGRGEVLHHAASASFSMPSKEIPAGAKPKNLLMIPARVALALQADGWWLRSDIIWSKPNPMPESVTDRPTSAHEHVFLLAKAERYFFDADAVREPDVAGHPSGNGYARVDTKNIGYRLSYGGRGQEEQWQPGTGRNIRNVWTIATSPYPEAHFATFPPELAERCIKAGTSEKGCCYECGAPWVRVLERVSFGKADSATKYVNNEQADRLSGSRQAYRAQGLEGPPAPKTLRWEPSCRCKIPGLIDATAWTPRPCTVLDPFGGAGTVGLVADRLQRNAILIELNGDYVTMAQNRIHNDAPLFA